MWDFDPTELHLMLETKEDHFPLDIFEKSSFEPYPDFDYQERVLSWTDFPLSDVIFPESGKKLDEREDLSSMVDFFFDWELFEPS